MVIATVASVVLSLCAICNSVPIVTLSELFRNSHIYTEDIKSKIEQYKSRGLLDATLQSVLRPVTYNALAMLTEFTNSYMPAVENRSQELTLTDVAVDMLPREGRRYAPLMSSGDSIDVTTLASHFPEYADLGNIVGGTDGTLTANEFVTIEIAHLLYTLVLEQRTVMDATDWQRFVTMVPTLTSGWSFDDLAGAAEEIQFKEFATFVFFVCTSSGPKTITLGKWTQMGGAVERFTSLTGGEDVLSWQTWKDHACGR